MNPDMQKRFDIVLYIWLFATFMSITLPLTNISDSHLRKKQWLASAISLIVWCAVFVLVGK
jgi:hypothetical protein